jgi:hypothetical protein
MVLFLNLAQYGTPTIATLRRQKRLILNLAQYGTPNSAAICRRQKRLMVLFYIKHNMEHLPVLPEEDRRTRTG